MVGGSRGFHPVRPRPNHMNAPGHWKLRQKMNTFSYSMCRKVEEGKMENNASGKKFLFDCKRDKITRDLWLNMVNQAKKK